MNKSLYRFAIVVAALILFLDLTGAFLTGNHMGSTPVQGISEAQHRIFGLAMGVPILALALWVSVKDRRDWLKRFAWMIFAVYLINVGLGEAGTIDKMPRAAGIVHALLGFLLVTATITIAVFVSKTWNLGIEPGQDYGWPSLRSLAIVAPVFVFLQVLAGAAYRHKAAGVLWHLLGAMLVAVIILILGAFALQQFPKHKSIRPAAVALLSTGGAQVFLGLGAFTMRMMTNDNTPAVVGVVLAHVAVGALTLASAIVLGIQIRRNVQPKPAEAATS